MTYHERFDPALPEFGPDSDSAKYFHLRHEMALPYVEGKRVLDIPCGVGLGTHIMSIVAKGINGVDKSEEAVEEAHKRYANANSAFWVGDMTAFPYYWGNFHVVVCFEGYEHISKEDQPKFLAEAHRVLVPGGRLLLTCPATAGTANPYHLHEPPVEELVEEVSKLFTIERLEAITDHASVFLVARKEKPK